jgi:hypothetical protein
MEKFMNTNADRNEPPCKVKLEVPGTGFLCFDGQPELAVAIFSDGNLDLVGSDLGDFTYAPTSDEWSFRFGETRASDFDFEHSLEVKLIPGAAEDGADDRWMLSEQALKSSTWLDLLFANKKEDARVVTLPDGFNGHTRRFYADPIETDGETVKLRCAEPGEEYLIAWRSAAEVRAAIEQQRLDAKKTSFKVGQSVYVTDIAPHADGWFVLHRAETASGEIETPDSSVVICLPDNAPGDYIGVLASQLYESPGVAAASQAIKAHRHLLKIEGDSTIQVWQLLASLSEYCVANGVDFDAQVNDVKKQVASGEIESPVLVKCRTV